MHNLQRAPGSRGTPGGRKTDGLEELQQLHEPDVLLVISGDLQTLGAQPPGINRRK